MHQCRQHPARASPAPQHLSACTLFCRAFARHVNSNRQCQSSCLANRDEVNASSAPERCTRRDLLVQQSLLAASAAIAAAACPPRSKAEIPASSFFPFATTNPQSGARTKAGGACQRIEAQLAAAFTKSVYQALTDEKVGESLQWDLFSKYILKMKLDLC